MNKILDNLSGGDLRSEGRAEEVAMEIVNKPGLLVDLTEGLLSDDKVVRARTCMTMEVISRDHPDLLIGTIPQLIELASNDTVAQVRWHIAEVLGNVPLSGHERERIIPILFDYLGDRSKIVKYCAVLALGVLGKGSSKKDKIVDTISLLKDESMSMAKAVRKALDDLDVD